MFKKIMAIILALSMAICLAACGNNSSQSETDDNQSSTSGTSETTPVGEPEGNESEKTEEPTFELSGEGKSMSELLAEANPANKYEELAAAHKICQSRFDLAVVSTEKVGLTEDSTMSGLIEEFGQQLGNLRDFLKEYEETGQEELNALDDNSDFMYYADYYLSALTKLYNMTSAIAKDPVLWLERYTLVPQSLAEEVESDGSWPEGYFFSDRVPAIENIDSLLVSETGKEYGFADGIEYTIGVNQFGEDQALTYIDQLMDAGFREDAKEEMYGTILWLGRLDDSEGHVSAIIVYNGSAAGTAVDPAFMVQFYNCDMIGIMLDIGTIY